MSNLREAASHEMLLLEKDELGHLFWQPMKDEGSGYQYPHCGSTNAFNSTACNHDRPCKTDGQIGKTTFYCDTNTHKILLTEPDGFLCYNNEQTQSGSVTISESSDEEGKYYYTCSHGQSSQPEPPSPPFGYCTSDLDCYGGKCNTKEGYCDICSTNYITGPKCNYINCSSSDIKNTESSNRIECYKDDGQKYCQHVQPSALNPGNWGCHFFLMPQPPLPYGSAGSAVAFQWADNTAPYHTTTDEEGLPKYNIYSSIEIPHGVNDEYKCKELCVSMVNSETNTYGAQTCLYNKVNGKCSYIPAYSTIAPNGKKYPFDAFKLATPAGAVNPGYNCDNKYYESKSEVCNYKAFNTYPYGRQGWCQLIDPVHIWSNANPNEIWKSNINKIKLFDGADLYHNYVSEGENYNNSEFSTEIPFSKEDFCKNACLYTANCSGYTFDNNGDCWGYYPLGKLATTEFKYDGTESFSKQCW